MARDNRFSLTTQPNAIQYYKGMKTIDLYRTNHYTVWRYR